MYCTRKRTSSRILVNVNDNYVHEHGGITWYVSHSSLYQLCRYLTITCECECYLCEKSYVTYRVPIMLYIYIPHTRIPDLVDQLISVLSFNNINGGLCNLFAWVNLDEFQENYGFSFLFGGSQMCVYDEEGKNCRMGHMLPPLPRQFTCSGNCIFLRIHASTQDACWIVQYRHQYDSFV